MVVKARFLRRPDVAPLPEDAPVAAIAEWLAQLSRRKGILTTARGGPRHGRFGDEFIYSEPIYDRSGKAEIGVPPLNPP